MSNRNKSALLVTLQFLCIFLLLITSRNNGFSYVAITLLISSIALITWAMLSMRKSRFRFSPVPANDAVLIVHGPYKYIRHPMYTAILLGVAGLLLIDFTWFRCGLVILLTSVLILKLHWEEAMLLNKFNAYRDYQKNTNRIIPFIY